MIMFSCGGDYFVYEVLLVAGAAGISPEAPYPASGRLGGQRHTASGCG